MSRSAWQREERAVAKTPQDHTVLKRQIDAVKRPIAQVLYNQYELTDEEHRIVENNA